MATIVAPYFDGVEIELEHVADPDDAISVGALNAFLRLTREDRASDSQHVFAGYRKLLRASPESQNG
ncbi:hypothetical protein OIU34_34650 [Pararhizobium sp. BT-229]|uniref:hypothetical protein n=1 Tax=Pararhizobium sp. BT-229 TaxID=2986923 RepID=UPI0021F7BD53|nr:hypothetical protein [Pararhizobium sp. BT-229]MCV9966979.1 hypothetical protein [Pararhizobium sp. BT-229]